MKIIYSLITFLLFSSLLCSQRYGDINLFTDKQVGYNFSDKKSLIPGLMGSYYFIQNNQDTCYLNGLAIGYNDNFIPFKALTYDIIYKFDKDYSLAKKVIIDAVRVDSKIVFLNNKLICYGSFTGELFIDGQKIYDSPDPEKNVKRRSYMAIFDEDLNIEKTFLIENFIDPIESIAYSNGKYYIAGSYQWLEVTLGGYTLRQQYRTETNNTDTEIFLFVMDAETYEVIDGKSFGGTARESVNQIEVNDDGNIWMMGKATGQDFRIDDLIFPTRGLGFNNDLFLLKLDKDINLQWFKEFGINANSDNSFLLYDENNVVFSGFSSSTFKINGEKFYESPGVLFHYFISINTNGNLNWLKTNEINNPKPNGMGFLKYNVTSDSNILIYGRVNETVDLYYNGEKLIETKEDRTYPFYIKVNRNTGDLMDHGIVFDGWSTSLEDALPLPNGNYYLHIINQRVPDYPERVNSAFWHINKGSSFMFEFNPTIPDIVNTIGTNVEVSKIDVYPNPVLRGDHISIDLIDMLTLSSGNVAVELYDAKGVLVQRSTSQEEIISMHIESNLPAGMYVIRVLIGTEVIYKKINVI